MISVLLITALPLTRVRLDTILQTTDDIYLVAAAPNNDKPQSLLRELNPDVMLIDTCLPEPKLRGVMAHLRTHHPDTTVIFLSKADDLHSGSIPGTRSADVCLLKEEPVDIIVDTIRTVVKHPVPSEQSIRDGAAQCVDHFLPAPNVRLTGRELEILRLVARGLSNRQIALVLERKVKTVEYHVSNILDKLQVSSRTEAALYAVRQEIV